MSEEAPLEEAPADQEAPAETPIAESQPTEEVPAGEEAEPPADNHASEEPAAASPGGDGGERGGGEDAENGADGQSGEGSGGGETAENGEAADGGEVPEGGAPPEGAPAEGGDGGEPGKRVNMKIERMQQVQPATLPVSYSQNGDEELLVLEYIENFRRQFVQLYPDRKELLLCPRNECGLEKFICTTIRPTKLEYNELYDLEACASFVAEHIQYEALQDTTQLPRYVPSPTSVLRWQMGDCIDMSIVLCSLLLGVGYDAYVVIGYADKTTCLADETNSQAPHLRDPSTAGAPAAKAKVVEVEEDYEPKQRPILDSDFVMRHDTLVRLDEANVAAESDAPAQAADEADQAEAAEDELHGQRIHCWVLVRAGHRDMTEDVFVEASTGKLVPAASPAAARYLGVEAVLNHQNYWVDFQRCAAVRDMSFDLDDFTKWEFIFMQSAAAPARADAAEGGDDGLPRSGSGNENEFSSLKISSNSRGKTPGTAEGGGTVDAQGAEEIRESDHILDLPPSWVAKLHVDRDDYLRRFARVAEEVKVSKDYRRSRQEQFAENSRADGMVQRLSLYTDLARTAVREEQEVFANRKDKLRRRVRYYQPGVRIEARRAEALVEELFDSGRPDALQRLVERPDGREFHFFCKATLDGMVKRVESFTRNRDPAKPPALHKVIETFEGHEARVNYRSITCAPPPPPPPPPALSPRPARPTLPPLRAVRRAAAERSGGARRFEPIEEGHDAPPLKQQIEHPRKMAHKFDRDPAVPADHDRAKKTSAPRPPPVVHARRGTEPPLRPDAQILHGHAAAQDPPAVPLRPRARLLRHAHLRCREDADRSDPAPRASRRVHPGCRAAALTRVRAPRQATPSRCRSTLWTRSRSRCALQSSGTSTWASSRTRRRRSGTSGTRSARRRRSATRATARRSTWSSTSRFSFSSVRRNSSRSRARPPAPSSRARPSARRGRGL